MHQEPEITLSDGTRICEATVHLYFSLAALGHTISANHDGTITIAGGREPLDEQAREFAESLAGELVALINDPWPAWTDEQCERFQAELHRRLGLA